MNLDFDRITHPLRLAKGSHQRGSGKGCAMNVISYINGDVEITDYPECSARPLARLVQILNDRLAGPDGFLSPQDSVTVIELGWMTVGTADVPGSVLWRWLADLLVDREMGVVKYARPNGVAPIRRVAQLCIRESQGDSVPRAAWVNATFAVAAAAAYTAAAAVAVGVATAAVAAVADLAAARAAFAAAAAAAGVAADAAAAAANPAGSADAVAAADAAAATAQITFTRWAIQHWRDLAGLDEVQPDIAAVNAALTEISAS